eukprot:5257525-Amphidinium_carterae.1
MTPFPSVLTEASGAGLKFVAQNHTYQPSKPPEESFAPMYPLGVVWGVEGSAFHKARCRILVRFGLGWRWSGMEKRFAFGLQRKLHGNENRPLLGSWIQRDWMNASSGKVPRELFSSHNRRDQILHPHPPREKCTPWPKTEKRAQVLHFAGLLDMRIRILTVGTP